MIKKNETNEIILNTLLGFIGDNNLFDIINEKGLIKLVDCEIDKCKIEDDYFKMFLKCTQKKTCNFTCSLMINGIEYTTKFGFEYAALEPKSCYKVNSNNCYEYLPFH